MKTAFLIVIFFWTKDAEICRQFDFQEQKFQPAMDAISALLRNCRQSLADAAKEVAQQVMLPILERISFDVYFPSQPLCGFWMRLGISLLQFSEQRALVEKAFVDNTELMEKQKQLVEEYCRVQVKNVEEQMKENQVGFAQRKLSRNVHKQNPVEV